jgi:hypothetical protein
MALRSAQDQRVHERQLADDAHRRSIEHAQQVFQAETILELQMAAQRLIRMAGRIHLEDTAAHRADPTQPFGRRLLPERFSVADLKNRVAFKLLAYRPIPVELSALAVEMSDLLASCQLADDEASAEQCLLDATDRFVRLQQVAAESLAALPPPAPPYRRLVEEPLDPEEPPDEWRQTP